MAETSYTLEKTPVHLGDQTATPVQDFSYDGPSWERYVSEYCSGADVGRLLMVETTPGDWPAWECHQDGDEVVIVLEGKGTFYHRRDGEVTEMAFEPGSTLINPKGVWHTADCEGPMKAIYITPCPGTIHEPR